MILYKNSSCIDELNLNITKIEYDSCIKQLKIDNNIDEDRELIIAVIDIVNEDKPITSFGFFHPDTGEKLDAAKSCSDKDVIMYEKILSVLNEPLSLKLLTEQKINIFDLNDDFYNDICFHFESPNGKDATLQDRIKTFYPNITLCDINCDKMNINFTTLEAECHCTFQDLLSKNIFQNDIFGNNVLIKEALEEVMEVLNNLNVEVLTCYKDVFDFNYFKKNIGGFIILFLFINETGACLFYYLKSKSEILRYIFSLTEIFLLTKFKKKSEIDEKKDISNPPIKKLKRNQSYRNNNINVNSSKNVINNCIIISPKNRKPPSKKDLNVNIKEQKNFGMKIAFRDANQNKECLIDFCTTTKKVLIHPKKKKRRRKKIKKKKINNKYSLVKSNVDLNKYIEEKNEFIDFDDVIEEDKRTFCEYYKDKLFVNQVIINTFFVSENIKPRSIKIALFILTIDLYFLINGLFYSDSYISEKFNSTEKETLFSFIPKSINRFIYSSCVAKIIEFIIKFLIVEEIAIGKILLIKRENKRSLRYEMSKLLKSIFKKTNTLFIINYIVIIFSWYYISCFNIVYPNINWIISV